MHSGTVLSEISIKRLLLEAWQKRINQPREGIHISDLIGSCLRQKCFLKVSDTPQPIDERQIKSFHVGIEQHRLVQELLNPEEWDVEKEFIFTDGGISIIAHPDLIHKKSGIIGEIKTSTKMIKQPYTSNVNQLKAYITMLSALGYKTPNYGKLLYIILSPGEEYFVEFTITVSEEEKKVILENLIQRAAMLQYGIDSRNASVVEHSMRDRAFFTFGGINFLCQSCPFLKTCLRYQLGNGEIDIAEEMYYQLLFNKKDHNYK